MSVAIYLVRILKRLAVTGCRRARWRTQYTNAARAKKNFTVYTDDTFIREILLISSEFTIDTRPSNFVCLSAILSPGTINFFTFGHIINYCTLKADNVRISFVRAAFTLRILIFMVSYAKFAV